MDEWESQALQQINHPIRFSQTQTSRHKSEQAV